MTDIAPIQSRARPGFWSRDAWRTKPPRSVRVGCVSVSSGLVAIPLALVVLGAACGLFRQAPNLPSWAYPDGDVLNRYNDCGGAANDLPPCRTIEIGSNLTMSDVNSALRPEFVKRGWTIRDDSGGSLSVSSPRNDICILYTAFYREQAEANASRYLGGVSALDGMWKQYSTLITVYVDDCSFKG